jgi:hypothetical protein
MRHINPQSTQVTSIFGGGYVQEHHADAKARTNVPTEHGAISFAAVLSVFFILVAVKFAIGKLDAASTVVLAALQ